MIRSITQEMSLLEGRNHQHSLADKLRLDKMRRLHAALEWTKKERRRLHRQWYNMTGRSYDGADLFDTQEDGQATMGQVGDLGAGHSSASAAEPVDRGQHTAPQPPGPPPPPQHQGVTTQQSRPHVAEVARTAEAQPMSGYGVMPTGPH